MKFLKLASAATLVLAASVAFAQTSTWLFGSAWVLMAVLSVYLYFSRTR